MIIVLACNLSKLSFSVTRTVPQHRSRLGCICLDMFGGYFVTAHHGNLISWLQVAGSGMSLSGARRGVGVGSAWLSSSPASPRWIHDINDMRWWRWEALAHLEAARTARPIWVASRYCTADCYTIVMMVCGSLVFPYHLSASRIFVAPWCPGMWSDNRLMHHRTLRAVAEKESTLLVERRCRAPMYG